MQLKETQTINLSDNLEKEVRQETYGLFPTGLTRYRPDNHTELLSKIYEWMKTKDLVREHGREKMCYNIVQVGDNLDPVKEIPELAQAISDAVAFHNNNTMKYDCEFSVTDCYCEIANEGALYAPHEHSNAIYSGTFFVNVDLEKGGVFKFRRATMSTFFPVMQVPSKEMTAFNMPEQYVQYGNGDFLIHPPNIQHGYEGNQAQDRISITFNVVPA